METMNSDDDYPVMDKQAIVAALSPAVVFLIVAIVSWLLDMELAHTISLFLGFMSVIGGGAVAWNRVYAKKSVDRIEGAARTYGHELAEKQFDEREAEHADMWQEAEAIAAESIDPRDY